VWDDAAKKTWHCSEKGKKNSSRGSRGRRGGVVVAGMIQSGY
jgi:hypothetical protein